MPTEFTQKDHYVGYAAASAGPGESVCICYRELIAPDASNLPRQLDNLQRGLFNRIPSLPRPSQIDHLLVVTRPDLTCTAYVNELAIVADVRTTRAVRKGEPAYDGDIADILSVDLGVDIPNDCGFVLVASLSWKRSILFDFGPHVPDVGVRQYPIKAAVAQQMLCLLDLPLREGSVPTDVQTPNGEISTGADVMQKGLDELQTLLSQQCQVEATYQELLAKHPWMLGASYKSVSRHASFNDKNIPDFTAKRCHDQSHDIIELKQPFLKLFREDSKFASAFHDAWDQAVRYVTFASNQRSYLRDEKGLVFENPKCILIIGHELSDEQLRQIRQKEQIRASIEVLTYQDLVSRAQHLIDLVRTARSPMLADFQGFALRPAPDGSPANG